MGEIVLNITYGKNEGLIMSPSELVERYLYGIPLTKKDGSTLPNSVIKQHLITSQSKIENWLNIRLCPEIITERFDFKRREWEEWGYVRMTYPVRKAISIIGYLNKVKQAEYPKQWLSERPTTDSISYFRNIYLVPNGAVGTLSNNFAFTGISPNLGWFGKMTIPNYWNMTYLTGYTDLNRVSDVIDYVGKMASIPVLSMIGDIILGVGVSSQSLSMDGLSQSIGIAKSNQGGVFSGRISQYLTEMKEQFTRTEKIYKGITFQAV
jgi:hypothetical protein